MERREFLWTSLLAALGTTLDLPAWATVATVEPYGANDTPWTYPARMLATWRDHDRITRLLINDVEYGRDPRVLAYLRMWLSLPAVYASGQVVDLETGEYGASWTVDLLR